MNSSQCVITVVVMASLFGAAAALRPAFGAQDVPIPNFSPAPDVGWISFGPEYIPPASGPKPVAADPAHPFIANAVEYRAGQPGVIFPDRQPTFPVADLTNPILQPWSREELRKVNEIVLSGKPVFEAERLLALRRAGLQSLCRAADLFYPDADEDRDDLAAG